jgi:hypothetical protein
MESCCKLSLKSRKLCLPLFCNSMVVPFLLYGSEVWVFEQVQILEKFQLQFCKFILDLKVSTPNWMVYGMLGIFPLVIQVKARVLCFWSKIINPKENKICKLLNKTMLSLSSRNIVNSKWINFVKETLSKLGMSEYFHLQKVDNINHF